jgi:hypothetical protein
VRGVQRVEERRSRHDSLRSMAQSAAIGVSAVVSIVLISPEIGCSHMMIMQCPRKERVRYNSGIVIGGVTSDTGLDGSRDTQCWRSHKPALLHHHFLVSLILLIESVISPLVLRIEVHATLHMADGMRETPLSMERHSLERHSLDEAATKEQVLFGFRCSFNET